MQKKIGSGPLGNADVDLFVDKDLWGGNFSIRPKSGKPKITIGLAVDDWKEIYGILLHEALEMAAVQVACRYAPSPDYSNSTANFMFVANHEQFADMVARAGQFMVVAAVPLRQAHKAFR